MEVRLADGHAGDGRCPRCAGRLRLTAVIGGQRTVALCATCDAGNPNAAPLLAYFAEHGSVRPQDMAQVSELLGHWLGSISEQEPEPTLAAQAEAWWSAYVSSEVRGG